MRKLTDALSLTTFMSVRESYQIFQIIRISTQDLKMKWVSFTETSKDLPIPRNLIGSSSKQTRLQIQVLYHSRLVYSSKILNHKMGKLASLLSSESPFKSKICKMLIFSWHKQQTFRWRNIWPKELPIFWMRSPYKKAMETKFSHLQF